MVSLSIIDPNAEDDRYLSTADELSDTAKSLWSFSILKYNEAIASLEAGDIDTAWDQISSSIAIYPYTNITLYFAFYLAIEIGEYSAAQKFLTHLHRFLSEPESVELQQLLENEVTQYNRIINNQIVSPSLRAETSLIHTYLLGLKYPNIKQLDIYRRNMNLHHFDHLAKGSSVNTPLLRVLIYAISILGLGIIFSSYNSRFNQEMMREQMLQGTSVNQQLHSDYLKIVNESITNGGIGNYLISFDRGQYEDCARILREKPFLIDTLKVLIPGSLEELCAKLYKQQSYASLSNINYSSGYHIHSDYFLLMKTEGRLREQKKVAFVRKYENSPMYVAPFLRELFDAEEDRSVRQDYALRLQKLIEANPEADLDKFLSNAMKLELE